MMDINEAIDNWIKNSAGRSSNKPMASLEQGSISVVQPSQNPINIITYIKSKINRTYNEEYIMENKSIKELNEEIQQFLEKTIAPEFQQRMQDMNAKHQQRFTRDAEHYRQSQAKYTQNAKNDTSGDGYWDREAAEAGKKAEVAEKHAKCTKIVSGPVYKTLAKVIDVENCTIIGVSTQDLSSKQLRKEIKKLGATDGAVLYPTESQLTCYEFYYSDNALKFRPVNGDGGIVKRNAPPMATFMQDLNSGYIAQRTDMVYIAYGPSIYDVRAKKFKLGHGWTSDKLTRYPVTDRNDTQAVDPTKEYYGHYDKSGYFVDTNAIRKKLANFKLNKGTFNKDAMDVLNKYDEYVNKFKMLMMDFNPRKDNYKIDKIYQKLTKTAWYFNVLKDALDEKNGERVQSYLKNCTQYTKELEELF